MVDAIAVGEVHGRAGHDGQDIRVEGLVPLIEDGRRTIAILECALRSFLEEDDASIAIGRVALGRSAEVPDVGATLRRSQTQTDVHLSLDRARPARPRGNEEEGERNGRDGVAHQNRARAWAATKPWRPE